jgi:ClpP class serine protease
MSGDGVRNDSHLSTEAARKLLETDGVDVKYGDIQMRVQTGMIDQALAAIAKVTPEERQQMRLSVMKALDRSVAKISAGKFTKKEADDFAADMCLLHALSSRDH